MFSDEKYIIGRVRHGILRQKKIVLLVLVWILFVNIIKIVEYGRLYERTGLKISVADVLILLLQDPGEFGIKILPLILFLIMKCKVDGFNIQYILRCHSKKRFLGLQVKESAFYSIIVTIILMGFLIALSLLWKMPPVNWSDMGSYFYEKTNMLTEVNFLILMLKVETVVFLKLMASMILLDLLMWSPKYVILVYVLIIVQSVIGMYVSDSNFLNPFLLIQYESWNDNWKYVGNVMTGVLVVALEYLVGIIWINKKDFYG